MSDAGPLNDAVRGAGAGRRASKTFGGTRGSLRARNPSEMGSGAVVTEREQPPSASAAASPQSETMTTPLGKGHRLSFGIGGVDDVDLLDRHDIGDIGVKVRGPRTSETRFGVRGSRFHIRFSFCRHFSLREIVRPRDPIVLLRRASRAPTRERGADALPTIIFTSQAMVSETRDAADGFEIDDRERRLNQRPRGPQLSCARVQTTCSVLSQS